MIQNQLDAMLGAIRGTRTLETSLRSFSNFTGPSKQNKSWTPIADHHIVAGAIRRLARAAKPLRNQQQSEPPAMNCRPHRHAIVAFAFFVNSSSAFVSAPLEILTCRKQCVSFNFMFIVAYWPKAQTGLLACRFLFFSARSALLSTCSSQPLASCDCPCQ